MVFLWLAALAALIGAACSPADGAGSASPADGAPARETAASPVGPGVATSASKPGGTEPTVADLIVELPPAPVGMPEPEPVPPAPVGLRVDALGIESAPVRAVGVEIDGDMEVPPADEVGWYRFGPAPGDDGSAVLAAHIAYDGEDGVFRHLDRLPLESIITVDYDDGSERRFVAVDKQQYDKQELPKDSIFAREGDAQLVLITCGGTFNRSLRSYDDNVVVYARPLDPAS